MHWLMDGYKSQWYRSGSTLNSERFSQDAVYMVRGNSSYFGKQWIGLAFLPINKIFNYSLFVLVQTFLVIILQLYISCIVILIHMFYF